MELTALEEEGEIQTIGRHKDLFAAIRNAKEGLLQYFVETESLINPHLRMKRSITSPGMEIFTYTELFSPPFPMKKFRLAHPSHKV